ncbi:MAG: cytochrome C oxidase subunit IV family protein [Acidobacteriota bacterium]
MAHATNVDHIVSAKSYIAVFVILLVMTATTTAVSFVDLGPWNTVVALAIAFFKATLVALVFMHVRWSTRLTQIVVVGGIFWLAILIGLTLSDFATRAWLPVYRITP